MATLQQPEAFVRWFRQVAPYLHAFRGRTFVVSFGGEMFAERARFASFIHDISIMVGSRRACHAEALVGLLSADKNG